MNIPDEPPLGRAPGGTGTRAGVKHGRWKWYYAAICDYRLAHPGCKNYEVAQHIKRHEHTVCSIVTSDMYREYEAQRKQAFRAQTDEELRQKLTGVTLKALNILDVQLEKKKDQVPIGLVREVIETGLDRLGFAPAATPGATVQIVNQQVTLPNSVSALALEEARMALRAVEAARLAPPRVELEPEQEAEPAPTKGPESSEGAYGTSDNSQ